MRGFSNRQIHLDVFGNNMSIFSKISQIVKVIASKFRAVNLGLVFRNFETLIRLIRNKKIEMMNRIFELISRNFDILYKTKTAL